MMVEPDHSDLSVACQCRLLDISRSSYYYEAHSSQTEKDLEDLKLILDVLNKIPFYGYRKVAVELQGKHPQMTRKHVRRIMRRFGLRALFPGPSLGRPRKEHKKYPYLLRGKQIRYPNQVWATDLTYIRLPG